MGGFSKFRRILPWQLFWGLKSVVFFSPGIIPTMVSEMESHHLQVVKDFEQHFLDVLEANLGLSLEVTQRSYTVDPDLNYEATMGFTMELNGSILGLMAILCDETLPASLLNLKVSRENREQYAPMMCEFLNQVGGMIAPFISETHPLVTLTSPRSLVGDLNFPHRSSATVRLETSLGPVELIYATDEISLKVVELLKKVEEQKSEIETQREEIQRILDHVPSAILTVFLDGLIGPVQSRNMRDIFGQDVTGKDAITTLFQSEKKRKEMTTVLKLLAKSPLPFKDIMRLAPPEGPPAHPPWRTRNGVPFCTRLPRGRWLNPREHHVHRQGHHPRGETQARSQGKS